MKPFRLIFLLLPFFFLASLYADNSGITAEQAEIECFIDVDVGDTPSSITNETSTYFVDLEFLKTSGVEVIRDFNIIIFKEIPTTINTQFSTSFTDEPIAWSYYDMKAIKTLYVNPIEEVEVVLMFEYLNGSVYSSNFYHKLNDLTYIFLPYVDKNFLKRSRVEVQNDFIKV
jgi:hypothetical protein